MSRSRSIRLLRRAASSRTTLRRVAVSTMRATPSSTAFSTTHSSLSVAIHACTSVTATGDSRSTGSWRVSSTCCPRAASRPWNSPPRPLNSTTASPSRKRRTCAAWCATFAGKSTTGAGGEVGLDEEAGFSHVARPGKKKGRRVPARSSVCFLPQAARNCGTRGVAAGRRTRRLRQFLHEERQREQRLVQARVVVAQPADAAVARPLREGVGRQRPRVDRVARDRQAPQRAVQRDEQRHRRDVTEHLAQVRGVLAHRVGLVHRRPEVQRQHAARLQDALAHPEELFRVQVEGRRVRVGEIEDDHVEALLRRLHVLEAVADPHLEARIAERALVDRAQPLLRDVDDDRIELRHHDALDARVLEQFLRRAAVAAADHQDRLGIRMRERGRVRHALVIEELVALGRHQAPVEPEELAELLRVVHLDALVRRLDVGQLLGRGVAVAGVRVEPVEDQFVSWRRRPPPASRPPAPRHRPRGRRG